MIQVLMSIRDKKADTYWKPFTCVNRAVGVREFRNLVNSTDSFARDNFADLELWELGDYDDRQGTIVSKVEYVCSGVDMKEV